MVLGQEHFHYHTQELRLKGMYSPRVLHLLDVEKRIHGESSSMSLFWKPQAISFQYAEYLYVNNHLSFVVLT